MNGLWLSIKTHILFLVVFSVNYGFIKVELPRIKIYLSFIHGWNFNFEFKVWLLLYHYLNIIINYE